MHVGVCEGVLNRLILADGSREDDSLAGVVGGSISLSAIWAGDEIGTGKTRDVLLQRCVSQAECFASEKTTLCVHAMEDLPRSV